MPTKDKNRNRYHTSFRKTRESELALEEAMTRHQCNQNTAINKLIIAGAKYEKMLETAATSMTLTPNGNGQGDVK